MMKISFNPFPNLWTGHICLRQIRDSDMKEVLELKLDSDSKKYTPRSVEETRQYVIGHIRKVTKGIKKNESISWAITLKGDDRLIGLIGFVRIQPKNFRAEVGYVLHPDFREKGIMSEALETVLNYGFRILKLNSVIAVLDPSNCSSEKLLIKYNFAKEAHLKENIFNDGEFLDTMIYSLLKKDYNSI